MWSKSLSPTGSSMNLGGPGSSVNHAAKPWARRRERVSKRRPSVQVLLWTFYSQIVILTKTSSGGRWGEESFSWVCSQGPRKPQVLIMASCLLDGSETLELHVPKFKSLISTSQEHPSMEAFDKYTEWTRIGHLCPTRTLTAKSTPKSRFLRRGCQSENHIYVLRRKHPKET